MLPERENIAISELAVYLPAIAVAAFVSIRHGFIKQLAWVYLIIFYGLRIAGAAMAILSIKHPTSRTDATWGAILGSIGLSPLLLASLGLLKRLNDSLGGRRVIILAIRLLHTPAILALILAIVGGERISSSDTSKQSSGQTFEKGGGILFLVVYLALLGLTILTTLSIRHLPSGENRILFAILAALPLLAVRLLYSLLADFKDGSTFNMIDGDATVQLCMAVVEEMIVTSFFLVAGFLAPAVGGAQHITDQIPMKLQVGGVSYPQRV